MKFGKELLTKTFGASLTDLSEAFDCLSNDLLIAKSHAYCVDIDSLNIRDYFSNRKQKTKVDAFFSSWEASRVLSGVPQGSILGSLSFDIFMCDMLLKSKATNFTGYGDDDTQFVLEIT